VNITTDEGPPVLAIEQGTATEAERSEWVRQLQIPMIYQVGDKKEFMLIHRTSAGAAAIKPLHGAANLADAAAKARSFLAKHPADAMLSNYDQDWKTYNDRESSNLMNIVAVIYGVALTAAISGRPSLILRPVSAPNLIPSLALLAAGLLTAVSFYGYVLSVGGDKPYDVTWTIGSNKTRGTVRFFADLVLATLYVHLLLAATHVETGSNRAPKLTGFVLAFVLVFAVATVVWRLRGKLQWTAIGATGVALALWWWAYISTPTRSFDFKLVGALLFGVILYGVLNHVIPYQTWKNHPDGSGPPRRDLSGWPRKFVGGCHAGAVGAFRRGALAAVGGLSGDTLAEGTDLTMAICRTGWEVTYEETAIAWTEAPASLRQLWRQRYRWCYGTIQSMWKHRRAIVEHGASGRPRSFTVPPVARQGSSGPGVTSP
jgi:Glycosyl transferase family group 2